MDAQWPGSRTRLRTEILELWGVWVSLAAAFVLILVVREIDADGFLGWRAIHKRVNFSFLALIVQPIWVNVPWIFLLDRRARPLVDPGRRTDMVLASVPAEVLLRRAFLPPIRRCAISGFAGTMIWSCILVDARHGGVGLHQADEFARLASLALLLAAEQGVAFALVVIATADLMARRLLPGRTTSSALGLGLYSLTMIAGAVAFFALSAWLDGGMDEPGLYVFVFVAGAFAVVLAILARSRVRTVLERYYQFE